MHACTLPSNTDKYTHAQESSTLSLRKKSRPPSLPELLSRSSQRSNHPLHLLSVHITALLGLIIVGLRSRDGRSTALGQLDLNGGSPGVDAFISQRNRSDHKEGWISFFGKPDQEKAYHMDLGYLPWIDQRGGEYFFTPSIEALKKLAKDDE